MRLLTRKLPTVSILIAFGAICFGCVLIKTVHTQDLIRKFFFVVVSKRDLEMPVFNLQARSQVTLWRSIILVYNA